MTRPARRSASQEPKFGTLDASGAIFCPESATESGSPLERHLLRSVRAAGLPEPAREFRFHPTRRWRLDFAFVEQRLAVEIEGGVYRGGGHTSVAGIKRDIAKGNALTLLGWRVLRFHGDQVRSGEATETIRQALDTTPHGGDDDGRTDR